MPDLIRHPPRRTQICPSGNTPDATARRFRHQSPGPLRGEPLQCSKRASLSSAGLTHVER